MHGTPRAYEPNNGFARTLFWFGCIAGCGYATWYFTHETIEEYFDFATVQTTYIDQNLQYEYRPLPNVTVCSKQPVSCKCPLWYSDLVLDNLEYTYSQRESNSQSPGLARSARAEQEIDTAHVAAGTPSSRWSARRRSTRSNGPPPPA
jgi:hypothetical protein